MRGPMGKNGGHDLNRFKDEKGDSPRPTEGIDK